jgi:hypothetical protein
MQPTRPDLVDLAVRAVAFVREPGAGGRERGALGVPIHRAGPARVTVNPKQVRLRRV